EVVSSENISKIGDEVGDKMGENDDHMEKDKREDEGESNDDDESNEETHEVKEDDRKACKLDMDSGDWKHKEDEGSRCSGEKNVREHLKEDLGNNGTTMIRNNKKMMGRKNGTKAFEGARKTKAVGLWDKKKDLH
ncbi:hypothetical protein Tco_0393105, partial [Tanacetum coccineum]